MIDYDTFCRIKQLGEKEGLNVSQIAAELGLDWRTTAFWRGSGRKPTSVSIGKSSCFPGNWPVKTYKVGDPIQF